MDNTLISLLACPACHGGLEETPDKDALHCRACGNTYPVKDGIPLLLQEEAKREDFAAP